MTRAVIELSEDVSPLMPELAQRIEGAGYSCESGVLGFNYKGFGVIVESKRITVNNAADEPTAREVVDWLTSRLNKRGSSCQ